jgi:hypothetical protein
MMYEIFWDELCWSREIVRIHRWRYWILFVCSDCKWRGRYLDVYKIEVDEKIIQGTDSARQKLIED